MPKPVRAQRRTRPPRRIQRLSWRQGRSTQWTHLMLAWFERRVDPFPETISSDMPRTFFAFLWECSAGVRPYLLWMTLLTAAIGAFEALLFSMLGRLIDWLGASGPAHFFEEQRTRLWLLAGILVASPLLIAVQA